MEKNWECFFFFNFFLTLKSGCFNFYFVWFKMWGVIHEEVFPINNGIFESQGMINSGSATTVSKILKNVVNNRDKMLR